MTAPQLPPGHVIAGKYTVRAPLGYGGATATYAAVLPPGREVVVKLFSPQLGQRRDVIAALQQAAAIVNTLPPELTSPVLETAFNPQTGAFFVVTDLVTLPSLIAQTAQGGPLQPPEVVALLQSIARVVDAAHAQNLVHGALKARNVFVGPAPGRPVKVVDFGVSVARAALPTNEGWAIAAPWMAPEQVQGAAPTPQTDVFSAALVAFYAATGKSYWRSCQGTSLDLGGWQQELAAPRVPPSARARELGVTLAPGIDVALGRALAPAPGERFASVSELAAALAQQAAPKMAMTMPLNAMPHAALEAMRRASPAQGTPAAATPAQIAGGDTLAIQSPAEAMQWQQVQAQAAALAPTVAQPAVPQMSPPQGMAPPMGQPQMQQQNPNIPLPTPLGGFQAQQGPPQGSYGPPPGPAYAQPQQPQYGGPRDSAVVLPKSRTGLVIGLVFGALFLIGGGLGVVFWLRSRTVEIPTQPVATTQTSTASGGTSSSPPPPPPTTAAGTTTAPPVETQDAGPAEADAGGAAAAGDAGSSEPAALTIVCIPDCDTAKIDDKPVETTDAGVVSPDPVDVTPGAHTISVGKASYMAQTKRVVLKPGQKDTETFRLAKPGVIPVAKPCGKFLERCPN